MSEVAGVGAGKFVRLAPLIAGKAPVKFADVKLVSDAPLIAGKAPVNQDADIVPEPILLAFKFDGDAPDPLNKVALKISPLES